MKKLYLLTDAIKMFFKVPDAWTDFDNERDKLREEIAEK